jgi:flagellar biosynthetic protein FliS
MREIAPVGPDRETVLLYGEAIAALGDAIAAIEEDNVEARCAAVCAATEVITTLYLNLDVRRCGEFIDSLADLYGRILAHLIGINLYSDDTIAQTVIELLEPLRDSWATPAGMIPACEPTAGSAHAPISAGTPMPATTVAPRRPAEARSPS